MEEKQKINKTPLISIIIPLYVINERFFDDLSYYDKLSYHNYELLIVSDKKLKLSTKVKNVKFLTTGQKKTGPAEKRDLALKYVSGQICAFIDDDAYPDLDWLSNALKDFADESIVAVGGPGLTPRDDGFWQKIGGYILESYLCSGGIQHRFYKMPRKIKVYDYPAYNLFVRTNILKKVGGYGSTFYGGEDTILCLKLTKYGKILYDPNVIVYHHRRKFPGDFLKQIGGVGLHRGYFFKKYPETSRQLFYLLPTVLGIGFFTGLIGSFINFSVFVGFTIAICFFILLAAVSVIRHKVGIISSIIAAIGIILTHITYGLYFVKGLLISDLKR